MPSTKTLTIGGFLGTLAVFAIVNGERLSSFNTSTLTGQITNSNSQEEEKQSFDQWSDPSSTQEQTKTADPTTPGSGSFASCEGYENLFPRNENGSSIDAWRKVFTKEVGTIIDSLQEPLVGEPCRQRSHAAAARLIGIVQQFNCALFNAPVVEISNSSNDSTNQEENRDDQSSFTSLELLSSMQDNTKKIQEATSEANTTLSILESSIFRCDPPEQSSASSSASQQSAPTDTEWLPQQQSTGEPQENNPPPVEFTPESNPEENAGE